MITFDHEHVPTELLRELVDAGVAVRPGPEALVHAQDKAVMRDRLSALGAPCPIYRVVPDAAALIAFGDEHRLAGDRQDLPRRLRRQGGLEARLEPPSADQPFARPGCRRRR